MSQLPTLILSQDNFVLPNEMKTFTVLPVTPNPASNDTIPTDIISPVALLCTEFVTYATINTSTSEVFSLSLLLDIMDETLKD